jgi:hypothetical protein
MKMIVVTPNMPLEEALRQGSDDDVVIIRDGRAVALVTPFDDDDVDWYARERDPAFIASIAEARKQVAEGKTLSHQELLARLGMK